ncbi:hypothetical protein E4U61_000523, partial [Claviceps capensis]
MKLQLSFVLFGLAAATVKLPSFQLANIDGVKRLGGGDDGGSVEQTCSPDHPYHCFYNGLCCSEN